jgi:hypothetical protein
VQPQDFVHEPIAFVKLLWPNVKLYNKQREVMESVRDNVQTFVPAGNHCPRST